MFHKVLQKFLGCHKVLQKSQQLETVLLILIYCRTKYNMSGGDVEPCPTSNDFVEWRLTGNISISIMLFFVELRASKNITLSNQQNISFSNQRNRTLSPCPLLASCDKAICLACLELLKRPAFMVINRNVQKVQTEDYGRKKINRGFFIHFFI